MADIAVVQAIEAHVRAHFTKAPVLIENDGSASPTNGDPYLRLAFPWSKSEQASIGAPGANSWSEEGAFTLTLSIPRGQGAHEARTWLGELAVTFRGREIGPVRCSAPQSPVADDDPRSPYFELVMAVPYRFWLRG